MIDGAGLAQQVAVLRAELHGLRGLLTERATRNWENHKREHVLIQDAVTKAEKAVDKRLEAMNELREQITTERGMYLTRALYDASNDELRQRVFQNNDKLIAMDAATSSVREDVAALRSSQDWMVRLVIGTVVTAIIGVIVAAVRFAPV